MSSWTFLSNHGRALVCISHDPGVRLRDVAAVLGITERRAYDIVADLTASGYVVKTKSGRRNLYEVRTHLPLPEHTGTARTIGELLDLLSANEGQQPDSTSTAGPTVVALNADRGRTTTGPAVEPPDPELPASA